MLEIEKGNAIQLLAMNLKYFALKYVSPEILGTSVPVYYETREWHAVTPDLSQEAALGRSTPRHSALAHLDT